MTWPTRLRAALLTAWLPLMLLANGLLISLVFQFGGSYTIAASSRGSHAYFTNFEPIEGPPDNRFRWSLPNSCICLPGVGAYPLTLRIGLATINQPGEQRQGQVLVNGQALGSFALRDGWNELEFAASRAQVGPSGDLRITLNMDPLELSHDPRPLVAQVSRVEVIRIPDSKVWPAPEQLGVALLAAALLYFGAGLLGVSPLGAALLGTGMGVLWSGALGVWHLPMALGATRLVPVLLAAFVATLLMRALCGWLLRRSGIVPGVREWQALCGAFAFGVLFKAWGMFHPAFLVLDHIARVHQLGKFGTNPVRFLETYLAAPPEMGLGGQLELGTAIPYSPFFYIVFSPLNWFLQEDGARVDTMNLLMAVMEASSVFGLYYVLRRGWRDGVAGGCAAAIFVTLPVSNLLYSDGGYPSIFAQWLLVLNVAVLAAAYPWRKLRAVVLAALVLAMLILSHTAIMLLVAIQMLVFVALVFCFDRPRFMRSVAWSGLGSLLAFGSYYVFSLPLVFGRIIPAVLARLGGGGSIGQDPTKLGAPLLGGFWPQVSAHFQTWPLLLAVSGYLSALRYSKPRSRQEMATDNVAGAVVQEVPAYLSARLISSRGLMAWMGAWFVSFALFSVVDLKVNLLQKHMEYAIPLLAILSGLSMSYLWRRSRAGKLLVCLLVALLALSSTQVWVARVLYRILQPGSG